jgi:hypothetical protein
VVFLCVLCVSGILLVENSQRKTKNQLKMASRAAMQWPSTRKHGLYQHNYLSIGTVQTTMWMQEVGAEVGGKHVLPHKFFWALEPGAIFCNLCLNGQSSSWCKAKVENGRYSSQATHFTVIPSTR